MPGTQRTIRRLQSGDWPVLRHDLHTRGADSVPRRQQRRCLHPVINSAVVARRSTGTWLVTVVTLASCVAVGACGAIPESPAAQQTTSPPRRSVGPRRSGNAPRNGRASPQGAGSSPSPSRSQPEGRQATASAQASHHRQSLPWSQEKLRRVDAPTRRLVGVAYVPVGSGGKVTRYGALTSGVGLVDGEGPGRDRRGPVRRRTSERRRSASDASGDHRSRTMPPPCGCGLGWIRQDRRGQDPSGCYGTVVIRPPWSRRCGGDRSSPRSARARCLWLRRRPSPPPCRALRAVVRLSG